MLMELRDKQRQKEADQQTETGHKTDKIQCVCCVVCECVVFSVFSCGTCECGVNKKITKLHSEVGLLEKLGLPPLLKKRRDPKRAHRQLQLTLRQTVFCKISHPWELFV